MIYLYSAIFSGRYSRDMLKGTCYLAVEQNDMIVDFLLAIKVF